MPDEERKEQAAGAAAETEEKSVLDLAIEATPQTEPDTVKDMMGITSSSSRWLSARAIAELLRIWMAR